MKVEMRKISEVQDVKKGLPDNGSFVLVADNEVVPGQFKTVVVSEAGRYREFIVHFYVGEDGMVIGSDE